MDRPPATQEEIMEIMARFAREPENIEQLISLLKTISQSELLEYLASHLSLRQLNEILHFAEKDPKLHSKLLSIMVGLPFTIFEQLFDELKPSHLQLLQKLGQTEPLQHQLTLFLHRYELLYTSHCQEVEALAQDIAQLPLGNVTSADIQIIKNEIEKLQNVCSHEQKNLSKALSIAWNSDKQSLIESFSTLKERHYHLLLYDIGQDTEDAGKPTGLYKLLENQLALTFGDPNLPNNLELLKDDDSAFEVLAKFSLWYLKDYWDLGLLPSISSAEQLKKIEKEAKENSLKFRNEVEQNLQILGLKNVGDFKLRRIYSRKMLKEFIENHRHSLF